MKKGDDIGVEDRGTPVLFLSESRPRRWYVGDVLNVVESEVTNQLFLFRLSAWLGSIGGFEIYTVMGR